MKNMLWQKTTNHTDLLLSITLIYNESMTKENSNNDIKSREAPQVTN
jgi:hypothetical protein